MPNQNKTTNSKKLAIENKVFLSMNCEREITLAIVLFPEPEGPTRECTFPCSNVMLIF
jgi:hypothetical protein